MGNINLNRERNESGNKTVKHKPKVGVGEQRTLFAINHAIKGEKQHGVHVKSSKKFPLHFSDGDGGVG
jgi:hypothetical protein